MEDTTLTGVEDASFDEGFDLGAEDGALQEERQERLEDSQTDAANADAVQEQKVGEPEIEPEVAAPASHEPQAPAARQPEQPAMLAEAPEAIKDELEKLRQLNPDAAQLAMEDSAEGQAIRSRLENFGAEMAQDRAEATLEKRQRRNAFEQQERARIEAHNRNFLDYMRKNAPEHYSLITDPNRQAEKSKYLKNVFEWIETKPYREAATLMEVARGGRDPEQVCNLLKRYESERRGGRPDATGALAVPSRGAPAAQTGIGDMDDFDAGWDMNRD